MSEPTASKKVIRAWTMYDWANSSYSLVITSAIFPVYYTAVTSDGAQDTVRFLGREFTNTALYSYTLSVSFLAIAFISPLLSGMADYRGNKKTFMKFFCFLGAGACASLFFFEGMETLWIGLAGFGLATIGWAGSIVYYNAFLPEIAEKSQQDRVSARGYALGYIGSSLLLIFNLVMISRPDWFGIDQPGLPARVAFLMVGLWWFGFALYTLRHLPERRPANRPARGQLLLKGFRELAGVMREARGQRPLMIFLASFFFYSMGVQTVMYVAALFGDKELQLESSQLIMTILIIQFVAIGGAYLFSYLSSRIGNFRALMVAIIVWIGICIGAYHTDTANQFYGLAFAVGMVMGGIQSLSRSTYSKMLPPSRDHASYFSFYEFCEKIGLVLGTASYGLVEELTGSMRNSVMAIMTFFIAGLLLLFAAGRWRDVKVDA